MDLLYSQIRSFTGDYRFDLTRDGSVDSNDANDLLTVAHKNVADLNFNGMVDFPDFLALSANYGQDVDKWSLGDINMDGRVDFPDFLILSNEWNQPGTNCPPPPQ